MSNETLLFALVAVVSYPLALLTSYAFVRWVLPDHLAAELGDKSRYVAIDGIRGYLAFGVYVHHYMLAWIYLHDGRSGSPPHNFENQLGKTSVAIFFMITAFLFWGRAHAKRGMNWKSFFISRLFRIYPLYLVFISLLFVAIGFKSNWVSLEPATTIAKEILKWFIFHTPVINHYYGRDFGGVTWTLLYEAWFYLSLPLLVSVFLQKTALWKKVAALGIAAGLFAINPLSVMTAAMFLGGVVAVYWTSDERLVRLAQGNAAAFVAVACLACEGICMYDPFNPAGIALLTVFFVVIASGNTLFGLLRIRAALWMGEISYSIYLIHGIILWVIMENILPRLPRFQTTTLWLAVTAIGIVPIVVLLPSASYIFIERPFIAIGHQIAKRKSV